MKLKELEGAIRTAVETVVKEALGDAATAVSKLKQIHDLQEEIEALKVEKGRREWDFQKREMEVDHKVGLERKRQEFEIEQAKREATVSLREENLQADRDRFEAEMKFIRERFEQEVGYLKDMMSKVLVCLEGVVGGRKDRDVSGD